SDARDQHLAEEAFDVERQAELTSSLRAGQHALPIRVRAGVILWLRGRPGQIRFALLFLIVALLLARLSLRTGIRVRRLRLCHGDAKAGRCREATSEKKDSSHRGLLIALRQAQHALGDVAQDE